MQPRRRCRRGSASVEYTSSAFAGMSFASSHFQRMRFSMRKGLAPGCGRAVAAPADVRPPALRARRVPCSAQRHASAHAPPSRPTSSAAPPPGPAKRPDLTADQMTAQALHRVTGEHACGASASAVAAVHCRCAARQHSTKSFDNPLRQVVLVTQRHVPPKHVGGRAHICCLLCTSSSAAWQGARIFVM